MNTLSPLLTRFLNNPDMLPKSAAAELLKANAGQMLSDLLKNGLDTQSAKTLIEHFATSLLLPGKTAAQNDTAALLKEMTRLFQNLPETTRSPAALQTLKHDINTLLKQMLHTVIAKPSTVPLPAAHTAYLQNQVIKSTDLAATLSSTLDGTDKAFAETKEKKEQTLFGLAENRSSSSSREQKKQKKRKGENRAELIQLLLSLRQSFKTVLHALVDFKEHHTQEQIDTQLPDLTERITYLKERIGECDTILKQLY